MKLISEIETKAAEYHADGDMEFSTLLASSAAALRAAEKMAEELKEWDESCNSENESTQEALAEWKAATE